MRKIREDEVTFSIEVKQDHAPVRGNDKADKEAEDEIIARLDAGDVWAWASVRVIATLTLPDGSTIEGIDCLGCCSDKDEEDFKASGYYDDMKAEALADLQRAVENEITRGSGLAEFFANKE